MKQDKEADLPVRLQEQLVGVDSDRSTLSAIGHTWCIRRMAVWFWCLLSFFFWVASSHNDQVVEEDLSIVHLSDARTMAHFQFTTTWDLHPLTLPQKFKGWL